MRITKSNIEDIFKAKQYSIETLKLKGYELIETLFVDNSGWGSESEPALTPARLIEKIDNLLNDYPKGFYAFLTGVGQFQVYLSIFKKIKRSESGVKLVAPNTLRIENQNGYTIRLYNTDILTVNLLNNTLVLFSGGYNTHTTRARIREFLPSGLSFYQNKGEWYIRIYRLEKDFQVKENESFDFGRKA